MGSNNIQTLIEKFEELTNDGKIDVAAKAKIPVCFIEDEYGGYKVFLLAERTEPSKKGNAVNR
jgi:hypothetical protein